MSTAVADARERYLSRRERGTPYTILTPEGVPLRFTVALPGDRIGAFVLDIVICLAGLLGLWILASFISAEEVGSGWLQAAVLVAAFLLRMGYFIWFEARGRGATPGKRRAGIRVIRQDAGPLTTEAIVVRNVTRVLELELPIVVLFNPEVFWPTAPGWVILIATAWLFIFAGMPLFNSRRLRIGDMLAGTMVVLSPQTLLLEDLGGKAAKRNLQEGNVFEFTSEQLTVYGIYELQVLEDLLRQRRVYATRDAMVAVTRKICRKIGWTQPVARKDVERFLTEFYAAMRAHQEQRLLFGKRKKDKHSKEA